MAESKAGQHERTSRFLLARFETWALPRLAASLPAWVVPDHMTLLGFLASLGIGAAYGMSNQGAGWLWVASGLLVVQWFGDSLDGTLARVRRIERPRYGFYLDHLVDAFATLAIGLGLGFSPYMLLAVGLAIVIAYHMLSINVYLETHVFGRFAFGYGMLGPSEVRVLLILLNAMAFFMGPQRFMVLGVGVTVLDVAGVAVSLGMLGMLVARSVGNLRELAQLEPARREGRPDRTG